MKKTPLRSWLAAAALFVTAAAAWHYLAPTQIGGSTGYVITGGKSMEPRFHTGDLAVLRPAGQYRVGDIAAYHSTLLRVVVLHRILGRSGDRYVFKGDNNNFIDPTRPYRAQLLGKLWFRVPRGGLALRWLHRPIPAALLVALFGGLMLAGAGEKRGRRRRQRRTVNGSGDQGGPAVSVRHHAEKSFGHASALFTWASVAFIAFLGASLFCFTRPIEVPAAHGIRFVQRATFAYSAVAPSGPVYPSGTVHTGDPIFPALIHRVRFDIDYRLSAKAVHRIGGTAQVLVQLIGASGWSRTIPLTSKVSFTGDHASAHADLDLAQLQSLAQRVQRLTGVPAAGGYTISLSLDTHVRGTLSGRRLDAIFDPAVKAPLDAVAIQFGGGSPGQANLAPSKPATVEVPGAKENHLHLLGHLVSVVTVRWFAALGLIVSGLCALLALALKRAEPFDEAARIKTEYGHLIVPVVLDQNDLGWPPVDVPDIKALARLAESGQRLILHRPDPGGDTFLVNDEGTVYRYRVQPSNVVWGEWKPAAPRPVASADATGTDRQPDSSLA